MRVNTDINKSLDKQKRLIRTYRKLAEEKIVGIETDQADWSLREAFVEHYAIWRTCLDLVRHEGIIKPIPNGGVCKNPALSIAENEAKLINSILSEMGISAKARKAFGLDTKAPVDLAESLCS